VNPKIIRIKLSMKVEVMLLRICMPYGDFAEIYTVTNAGKTEKESFVLL
jgi:hypothetical protein